MKEHNAQVAFTEEEKQWLTARLTQAAQQMEQTQQATTNTPQHVLSQAVSRRSSRRWVRRVALCGAVAALSIAAAAASGAFQPLFQPVEASLTVDGQKIPSEARMVLNTDGSATVTVKGSKAVTTITVPSVTVQSWLTSKTCDSFLVTRTNGEPYELQEEDGRLWLFVNQRIPLDVTDKLAEGYTFTYYDENDNSRTATVSGTVSDYQVTP